jgi:plasmid maintenance system antidote protein VapI
MKKFYEIEVNAARSNDLLDAVLRKTGLKNDAALARALEVAPPVISKIRHGRLPVGASLVVRVCELTEMGLHEIKAILLGEVAV